MDRLEVPPAGLDERVTPHEAAGLLQRLKGDREPPRVPLDHSLDDDPEPHWIDAAPALGGP